MTSYIALLRGINVGGKAMVSMAELRELFEKEGFADVKTLLQSGNVIFKNDATSAALETQLEKITAKKFGREISYIVRDKATWEKIVAKNPFHDEAKNDPSHLVVLALKITPDAKSLAALKEPIVGREYFKTGEKCLYLVYPDGIGTSKLTSAVLDRHLGVSGTARNWNTVLKIAALLAR